MIWTSIERRTTSRWLLPVLLACVLCIGSLENAQAQSCCVGASGLTPTRLELHEWLLVGTRTSLAYAYGSYDTDGILQKQSGDAVQVELRQELFASMRVFERAELSGIVPWLWVFRRAREVVGEQSLGIGDSEVRGRLEVLRLHERRAWPAASVHAAAILPTGRPVEESQMPLGSDATGAGVMRVQGGLSLEYPWGDWVILASVAAQLPTTRSSRGVQTDLGPRAIIQAGLARQWSYRMNSAILASHERESAATVDGRVVANTQVRRTQLAMVSTWFLDDAWRLRGQLHIDVPLSHWGKNQSAEAGAAMSMVRSWL